MNCVKLAQYFNSEDIVYGKWYLALYDLQLHQMNLKQEAAVPNGTAEQINEHEIKMGGM